MEFKDNFYLLTQFFGKVLALPLSSVLGIFKLESITPIPNNKNKYLLGVTSAKGHIVPVIDLKMGEEISKEALVVIFETSTGKRGAVFKDVEEVIPLSKDDLNNAKICEEPFHYLSITKDSKEIILIDLDKNYEFGLLGDFFKNALPKAS